MAIGVHGPTICLPPALHNVRSAFAVENSLIAKSAGDWGFSTQYKNSRALKAGYWSLEYYFWGNLISIRSLYAYRGSCAKTLAILTSREDYR